MNTYVVTPPKDGKEFEIEAEMYIMSPDAKTIHFQDGNHEDVATYVAIPGTLVKKKKK